MMRAAAAPARASSSQGVSNLQGAFQSLMQDLSTSAAASGSSSSTPSLQSFLQSLLQNLQTQGAAGQNLGQLVNATA